MKNYTKKVLVGQLLVNLKLFLNFQVWKKARNTKKKKNLVAFA